jgi:hypothetical protein
VRKIWGVARNASGDVVFPGLVPGGEAAPGGWRPWVTGAEPFQSLHWLAAEGFFRHFVFEDPDWDFRTFDYDTDLAFALDKAGPALDATDPDLRPLRDAGAKLLVYHGASNADISPVSSIDYFEEVVATTASPRSRRGSRTASPRNASSPSGAARQASRSSLGRSARIPRSPDTAARAIRTKPETGRASRPTPDPAWWVKRYRVR